MSSDPEDNSNESKKEKYQRLLKIQEQRTQKIGALLDYNQKVTTTLRVEAKNWEAIALALESQRDQAQQIAEMAAIQARINADLTGDIISTEFGIIQVEEIDESEDDDIEDYYDDIDEDDIEDD